jgi:hypothetical protein
MLMQHRVNECSESNEIHVVIQLRLKVIRYLILSKAIVASSFVNKAFAEQVNIFLSAQQVFADQVRNMHTKVEVMGVVLPKALQEELEPQHLFSAESGLRSLTHAIRVACRVHGYLRHQCPR